MRIPNRDGRRRPIVGLLFGIWTIAVFAACSSGSSAAAPAAGAAGASTTRDAANIPAASAGASAAAAADSGSGSGSNAFGGSGNEVALVSDAQIVRTGSLELEVADVAKAVSGGRDAIRALGGYIGASQQQQSGDQTIASVTYRIPAARWEDALTALRGLGSEVAEKTDATEVTAQIVDLDARIRNLKASEQALVGYAERAPKVTDLLEIQSRLTDTRGQIEQLTAQQANLKDQAAMATLTVTFSVKAVAVTQASEHWDPAAEVDRASATLIGIGQGIVSFAIVLAIVWLPVLAVLGFIGLIALVIARRIGWRRPGDPPTILPPAVSPPA
ncbi:MAG TPA: DUF4349 domain-containing protein [Candidatus Bathyarchaeia archaeon]|nr:DUF4349 domain-containing protein [Candidatus Bathyarchaeia archaeon]